MAEAWWWEYDVSSIYLCAAEYSIVLALCGLFGLVR